MKHGSIKTAILLVISGILLLMVIWGVNLYQSITQNPSDLGTIAELSLHQEIASVDHLTIYGGYSKRIALTTSAEEEINIRMQGNPEALKSNISNRHFIVGEPFEIEDDPRCHWLFGCKDLARITEISVEIPDNFAGTITIVALNPSIQITNEHDLIEWNRLTIKTANSNITLGNIQTDMFLSTANLTLNATDIGGQLNISSAALSGGMSVHTESDLYASIQAASTNLRLEQFPDQGVLISSNGVNSYVTLKDGSTRRSLAHLLVDLDSENGEQRITLDIQSVTTALRFIP